MSGQPARPPRGHGGAGIVLGLGAALCWFAWFGWDRTYHPDPERGVPAGPYEAWQVVGTLVTLVVLASIGARRAGARATVVSLASGFTAAWSVTASAADDTGTWGVGAVIVLVGVAVGTGIVALVVTALSTRRPPPAG